MKSFTLYIIALLAVCGYAWAAEEEHPHETPHGGQVKTMGNYHVEFLIQQDGKVKVYLLDNNVKPLPAEGVEGVVYLRPASGGGMKTVQLRLAADKGYLEGGINLKELSEFEAAVRLTIKGQKFTPVKFNYPVKPSAAEEDHPHETPHGGEVKTMGDYHVEFLIQKDEKIKVYLLDKNSKPLSAEGVEGSISLNPGSGGKTKTAQLKLASDKGYLEGSVNLKELPKFEASVTLKVKGEKLSPVKFSYPAKHAEKSGKGKSEEENHH